MYKYLIILTILLKISIAVNPADIYTNDIKPVKYTIKGIDVICLDLPNAQIMESRFQMLWFTEDELLQYSKENEKIKLQNKLLKYGCIGCLSIILIETFIIIVPK